jgi:ATP-dependent exoDNAse (exonuclease V) alpha subunit
MLCYTVLPFAACLNQSAGGGEGAVYMASNKQAIKLYWVTTDDHAEASVNVSPPSSSPKSSDRKRLIAALKSGSPVVLLHGRAGTGKTTLIHSLKKEGFRHVVVAPTGIAALNAGGQTVHKFFGIPPRIVNLDDIKPRHRLGSILRRIDIIVIDEISMVRADLLDVVDKTLRVNLDPDEPFGGKKLLLVGDFLQLPPIVEEADAPILEHRGYEFTHAFGARCLFAQQLKLIELSTVYRQSDPEFLDLLHNVRNGERLEDTVRRLNLRCHRQPSVPR